MTKSPPKTTANGDEASNEMVIAVDNLIDLITNKFSKVTGDIFAKRRFCVPFCPEV